MKKCLLVTIAALTFAAAASAATPIYWTPAHMGQTLQRLAFQDPACHGIGVRHKTGFGLFRCTVGGRVIFVRPMSGGACAAVSKTALCQPIRPVVAGDPRSCSATADDCVKAAAALAARRYAGGPGGMWQGPAFTCSSVGPLVLTCPLSTTTYTVTFQRTLTGWTIAVTG